MKSNLKEQFKNYDSSVKGFIIIIIMLIIGIILRWEYIYEGISEGFEFFSK